MNADKLVWYILPLFPITSFTLQSVGGSKWLGSYSKKLLDRFVKWARCSTKHHPLSKTTYNHVSIEELEPQRFNLRTTFSSIIDSTKEFSAQKLSFVCWAFHSRILPTDPKYCIINLWHSKQHHKTVLLRSFSFNVQT